MPSVAIFPSLQRELHDTGLPIEDPRLAEVFENLSKAMHVVVKHLASNDSKELLSREAAVSLFCSVVEHDLRQIYTEHDRQILMSSGVIESMHARIGDVDESQSLHSLITQVVERKKNEIDLDHVEAAARDGHVWSVCVKYFRRFELDLTSHLSSRRDEFRPDNAIAYPVRNIDGDPIEIDTDTILDASLKGVLQKQDLLPFLSIKEDERKRAQAGVTCRAFRKSDVRRPTEATMLDDDPPHMTVATTRAYRKGQPLFIFSGRYGQKSDIGRIIGNNYVMKTSYADSSDAAVRQFFARSDFEFVIGEGLASRVNTIYEEKPEGGFQQAREGYNVRTDILAAKTRDGRSIFILLDYAASDLPPDTDLRRNYGESDKIVTARLGRNVELPLSAEQMASKYLAL